MLQSVKDALRGLFTAPPAPAYVLIRPDHARRCPECGSGYAVRDRYCPRCNTIVPEWRFG
jgi:hypothetical protein